MIKFLTITLLVLHTLALTQEHQHYIKAGMGFGTLIFICLIFGCVGYCFYRCRGTDVNPGHRHGHGHRQFWENSSDSSHRYRQPPPQQVYARPPVYYPQPQPQPIAVNRYYAPPPYASQNDASRAVNQNVFNNNWEGPDYFAEGRLRQNCGYCNSFSKYGEQPRIMLNCPSHHAFHIACLNQYRVSNSQTLQFGTTICPTCREPSTQKVRFFCQSCKQKYAWVDLSAFSDAQGVIDTTRLTGHFKELCPTCRNM